MRETAPTPDNAEDFRQRLASIERCIPHMVDNGGIWPRDVEWLIAELRAARKDSERLDWILESGYQGIMVEPDAVRPELVEGREYGPYYVESSREAIDAHRREPPSSSLSSEPRNG